MSETLQIFDLFIDFCLVHGNALRAHKQFGQMAKEIRSRITSLESELTTLKEAGTKRPIENDNAITFKVIRDGNSWFFALPDFVNLQESKAIFLSLYDADMDYIYSLLAEQLQETIKDEDIC